jgi:hypothetical protein
MIEWLFNIFGYVQKDKQFDSLHTLLEHDAIRQQYKSLFGGPPSPPFAGLGNPWRATLTDQNGDPLDS